MSIIRQLPSLTGHRPRPQLVLHGVVHTTVPAVWIGRLHRDCAAARRWRDGCKQRPYLWRPSVLACPSWKRSTSTTRRLIGNTMRFAGRMRPSTSRSVHASVIRSNSRDSVTSSGRREARASAGIKRDECGMCSTRAGIQFSFEVTLLGSAALARTLSDIPQALRYMEM